MHVSRTGEKRRDLDGVKDAVEIADRTTGSQSFHWQMGGGLIRKSEKEGRT